MPSENQSNSSHFEKTVFDATKAATALSQSIDQENRVYLNFCQSLVNNTLQAMSNLNKLEINAARIGAQDQFVRTKQTVVASNEDAKHTIAQVETMADMSPVNPSHDANLALMNSFAESMSDMMLNSVSGQQKLHVIAEAATTKTIEIILSMAPAVLAETVKEIAGD